MTMESTLDDWVTDDPDRIQPFAVGDRVVDSHSETTPSDDDYSPMRVVDPNAGTADEAQFEIDGTPLSEYPGNEDYPADSIVVTVVYESNLDATISDWEESVETLQETLAAFREEWKVDIKTHDFLAPRLAEASAPDDTDR